MASRAAARRAPHSARPARVAHRGTRRPRGDDRNLLRAREPLRARRRYLAADGLRERQLDGRGVRRLDRRRGRRRGLTVPGDDASALVDHPTLRRLERVLAERPGALAPDDGAPRRAAVAIVLRNAGDGVIELLLIKRSEREDDPWSGHIALPGGRHDPTDATLQDTA